MSALIRTTSCISRSNGCSCFLNYGRYYTSQHRSHLTAKYLLMRDSKIHSPRVCFSYHHRSAAVTGEDESATIVNRRLLRGEQQQPFYRFNIQRRDIHLGSRLYETASSKVETTVQKMKEKQKEKVEEILKEAVTGTVSSAEAAAAVSGKASGAKATATTAGKKDATTSTSALPGLAEKAQETKPVLVKKPLRTRIWEELVHMYHGFRLLFIDINVSRKLLWQVLNGKTLTRRENNLLVRTTSDLFRLIPFSVFIIVPFMEFLLPFFIKFFPGMMPSTFQTAKEREDKLKAAFQVKLEMAKFLQKTLDEMAVEHRDHRSEDASQFAEFFRKIKDPNEYVSNDDIIKFAKRFDNEITLDNLSREQLAALCRVLELNTMGTSNFLRFQLRMKLRSLEADDRVIAREGVESLNLYELQQACKARGMRAYGLTEARLTSQLQEWISLSLNEKVPPTLLLLSRAMQISEYKITAEQLKETIRVLPDSVAAPTKAAIGESEGKIENKTKIEVIKEELRKIKEEKEEEREIAKAKKADLLSDSAPIIDSDGKVESAAAKKSRVAAALKRKTDDPKKQTAEEEEEQVDEQVISPKDIEILSTALKTISSDKQMVVEKNTIKEIKAELEEYKEDLEELHEVRNVVKEPVTETRAAKLLFKKVNTMLDQLEKAVTDLEKKEQQKFSKLGADDPKHVEAQPASVPAPEPTPLPTPSIGDAQKPQELIHIYELMERIKQLKQTSNESRLKQIENVLSKIDVDKDGAVSVEDTLKVISALARENVKLDEKQIEEVVKLLGKEELIQLEEKIEKMLAKSKKEIDMVRAKKQEEATKKRLEEDEFQDKARKLQDEALDLDEIDKRKSRGLREAELSLNEADAKTPTVSSTSTSAKQSDKSGGNSRGPQSPELLSRKISTTIDVPPGQAASSSPPPPPPAASAGPRPKKMV